MRRIILVFSILVYSSIAAEKGPNIKEKVYNKFFVEQLLDRSDKLDRAIDDYNKKHSLKFSLKNKKYFIKFDKYTVSFEYTDTIFSRIYINGKKFKLIKNESREDLRTRLKVYLSSDKKYSLFDLIISDSYASTEIAFEKILSIVLDITEFEGVWFFGSDDAKIVYDEIRNQRNICESSKANYKYADNNPKLKDFLRSVLYSPEHPETKNYMEDVRAVIMEEYPTANEEKMQKHVDEMRHCAALAYLVGKGEEGIRDTAIQNTSLDIRNIGHYGSGDKDAISGNKSKQFMANFCKEFDQLASCLTEHAMMSDDVADEFQRSKKELIQDSKRKYKEADLYKGSITK